MLVNNNEEFASKLTEFVSGLQQHVSTEDGQWTIKGFIDLFKNVYSISSDLVLMVRILKIEPAQKTFSFLIVPILVIFV